VTQPAPGLRVACVLGTASGGTARHAGLLAEGCRRAGLTVLAIGPASTRAAFTAGVAALTPTQSPPAAAPGPSQMPYHVADISDWPRPVHDAAVLAALRSLLRQAQPDVVHAHGLRAGAMAALALLAWPRRRRAGLRHDPALVVTVHNAPPAGHAGRVIYGVLELICARRADTVLCASADLATRMRCRHARTAEFDVPAPPAPAPSPAAIARARADLGPPDRPAVLAVARLAEQKGLDVLLAAAAGWRDREPAPFLAVAGEGPLAAGLAAAAGRAGVDLALLGQRDDVPALLAAADVVVIPSRWEARSLVVQEAMRAGRPVVASRVGGIPALTGEDAAVLVPPGDPAQLAAAVLSVLDDPGRAARMSAAARDRAAALPGPADAVAAVLAVYRAATQPR
jgi:glycosyltransferase involved in cell wall biosynthesis